MAARILGTWTWLFFAWSLVPVALAVRVSFAEEVSAGSATGLSLSAYRAVIDDPLARSALLQSLGLAAATTLLATPLGLGVALGLTRTGGPRAGAASLLSVLPLAMPQVVLAVAFFLVFVRLYTFVPLGAGAQLLAHVTLALPVVAAIARARLLQIGREVEEMAMDLGASPTQVLTRVLLPEAGPAILAGAAVAFVLSLDTFVLSQWLCIDLDCQTVPMLLYGRELSVLRSALGSVALAGSLASFAVAGLAWRWAQRSRSG